MQPTWIAFVCIPAGLYLLVFSPKWLYRIAIFTLPFSATAIANFGADKNQSGLQVAMFFGVLWMAQEFLRVLSRGRLEVPSHLKLPSYLLGSFALVVFASLLMPVWFSGHILVRSAELLSLDSVPLELTTRQITQTAYLMYGIIFTILVAIRNSTSRARRESLQIYVLSSIVVSCWGLVQFGLYELGIEYPAFIFNNSRSAGAQGFGTVFEDFGLKRISSVATEPSLFAQFLCSSIVIVFFAVLADRQILSRRWDRFAAVLMTAILLLTTSGSAYLGFGMLLAAIWIGLWYFGWLRARHVFLLFAVLLVPMSLILFVPVVQQFFIEQVISKPETYSGVERFRSVLMAHDYFSQSPLLGIGWGSATSHDLIFKLLSNTGILGLASFGSFAVAVAVRLIRQVRWCKRVGDPEAHETYGLIAANAILLAFGLLTGFAFVYGHFWFCLALGMAAGRSRFDGTMEARNRVLVGVPG